jgi:putative hemolysin
MLILDIVYVGKTNNIINKTMEFLIIAVLIILNGVFSMSEIALVSSRKFKLEVEAKKGNKNARKALDLADNPNTFLSTVQIGITLIGILTGIFSGQSMTSDLTAFFYQFPFLSDYASTLGMITVVVIITYLTIVFGELLPKRLGLSAPEKISSLVATPMMVLSAITKPLIWLLTKTNDFFITLLGIKENQDGIATEEEIKAMIQQSTEEGEIEEIEQEIVSRVFSLGDRKAGELMTHRNNLVWIDSMDTFSEIKAKVDAEPHSVYPVCDDKVDNLIGLISLKQLFREGIGAENFVIGEHLHEAIYVPENMAAYRVLEHFKLGKLNSAIVVDEYGSLQGIITMDDVMDELIGDSALIEKDEYQIIQRNDNSWLVDGQLPYFELVDYFNISNKGDGEVFSTVAGLFISIKHHIPITGDKITWKGYTLEVVDMDGHRIDKVLISKL